jgi:hypothetical protein
MEAARIAIHRGSIAIDVARIAVASRDIRLTALVLANNPSSRAVPPARNSPGLAD